MAFAVIREPLASDWYPCPFADVHALGCLRVVVDALWIAVLFTGLAACATVLDRHLARGAADTPQPPAKSSIAN
jgi:hypothetical protein